MKTSVAIVQRIVPHYRVPFFTGLHNRLEQCGIALTLFYGQEQTGTVPHSVNIDESWGVRLNNSYWRLRSTELVWQPCLGRMKTFDCVVVEQANRLLINHFLQAKRLWARQKLAFWGHGCNMQARVQDSWRERFKKWRACDIDWWFAYTGVTRDRLLDYGFPSARITTVNNAIDTSGLRDALAKCRSDDLLRFRKELGIGNGPVAMYCGGLYADKRIDFLIEACHRIRAVLPDFHVIVIGEGPESAKVVSASERAGWMHYLGPIYGDKRAPYLKLSDIILMPGAVGLVVIDSFVSGVPLATTDISMHGPEAAYLRSDVNGIVTDDSPLAYADAVVAALTGDTLAELRQGCRQSADMYTLEKMVDNFADGVIRCLDG